MGSVLGVLTKPYYGSLHWIFGDSVFALKISRRCYGMLWFLVDFEQSLGCRIVPSVFVALPPAGAFGTTASGNGNAPRKGNLSVTNPD